MQSKTGAVSTAAQIQFALGGGNMFSAADVLLVLRCHLEPRNWGVSFK